MGYIKNYRKIVAYIMIALLTVCMIQPVYASESKKQIVKVAYFDMGNYYEEESDGIVDSYDTEMLNMIQKYSNLSFEYVNCGTWAHAVEMLEQHEVDLVGTFQWTYEREQRYEFCLEGYGYSVGELASLQNQGYIYEDYDAIGKSIIGCVKGYVREPNVKQLFQDHGINPEIKYYDNQMELENALELGEVDLIAANSHTLKDNYVTIEKFTYAPFFFASWKGNTQLTDQIDDAIISINIQEPEADDVLMKKYFPSIMGTPLTKEEQDLIAQNKTYDVYFDASTRPTSWYDEESGTMKGGLVEVCRQVSEITGLKLNPVPMFAGQTKLDDTAIRTTTVYEGTEENPSSKPGETRAFLNENFNLYYRDDKRIDLNEDTFSVAIVANRVHLIEYINNNYPNATIEEYATPVACLKAVASGKTDLTYLDCRIADNAITENGLEHVKEFPIDPQQQGIALLFPEEDRDLLVSIVNKGLEKLDEDALSDFFVQCALETDKPVTFQTLVRDYFIWFVLIGIILILILISFAILITYANVMKKQKDKIVKADADRTEFFGRMSHDMRTPMNGIMGMIELSETSDNMLEVRENLHKAKSASKYMLSLINDTLDLQRLESKKLQLEKDIVQIKDYYNEIFSIMKVSAEKKNLDFKVKYIDIDMDDYVQLDVVRVKQIFSNLISNAIKFTPDGGAIEVTIESQGQDGDILHRKYQVKDTGVGMSEDFIRNRLFKPYSQENNQLSTQLTGSGLGMAITKNLVEIMGGHLEVESSLGEGTIFTVYLDIKRASKVEVEKVAKKKSENEKTVITELSGKRILLCEDHPLNAEIAKKILEKAGCIVVWAENGKIGMECFEQSEENEFDAILMDIRMPVMDGLESTKAIRNLSKADAKKIPIIAMTANAYRSDIQNCLDAGMNAHIAKPVDPNKLYATLADFI